MSLVVTWCTQESQANGVYIYLYSPGKYEIYIAKSRLRIIDNSRVKLMKWYTNRLEQPLVVIIAILRIKELIYTENARRKRAGNGKSPRRAGKIE